MSTSQETVSRGQFPIDNVTYDLITLIHEKSKGLEAFDKYVQDAQGNNELSQLLQQIRQQDTENVQRLVQLLQRTGAGVQSGSSSS
jgi:uncharacterized protein YegL